MAVRVDVASHARNRRVVRWNRSVEIQPQHLADVERPVTALHLRRGRHVLRAIGVAEVGELIGAQIADRELRVVDAIGRYGGDEFLLVLSQTGVDGARECAERIRARIELSDSIGGEAPRQITVSCGITRHRRGESLAETLQRADAALYRAKHRGRNCVEVE